MPGVATVAGEDYVGRPRPRDVMKRTEGARGGARPASVSRERAQCACHNRPMDDEREAQPAAGRSRGEYAAYFAYLMRRKRLGLLYRNVWLYPRLARHLPGKALDVGCGIGDFVRFRPHTMGVDVNPEAVGFCAEQGLDVRLMRPDELPFGDGTFDSVNLDNVLEHLEHPQKLLAEIRRVLAPDGVLLVGVPGERGFASDPDHKRHYPQARLVECLRSAGFEPRRLFHQPFRSKLLDRRFRYYALYGLFGRGAVGEDHVEQK